MQFSVYIVLCNDGTFYTGYAVDLLKRIDVHNSSKTGAKYTKIRRPVKLVYSEHYSTKSEAMKREYVIKQLSHNEKKKLAETQLKEFGKE